MADAKSTDQNIRVSAEDLAHFPGREEETVARPDGGYLGTLNVFHELHCIVRTPSRLVESSVSIMIYQDIVTYSTKGAFSSRNASNAPIISITIIPTSQPTN